MIANTFNSYFILMGNSINNNLTQKNGVSDNINNPTQSLYLRKTTKNEIISVIMNMKGDSAPGKDGISINVIKHIKEFISDTLAHIFNTILSEGSIPNSFKIAVISPVHKSGDKTDINNYRPISLLNVFSKIFEIIIKKRLLTYLEENLILPISQYGFRENLGTEDALAQLSKDIYTNLEQKNKTLGIFMDLSKAFDSISHVKLLSIFQSIGINNKSYKLFKSYLQNRKQQVQIGDTLSNELTITNGVPQGTVLSPILYIIYVAELGNLNIHGKLFSYADDTALIISETNWEKAYQYAESDMCIINEWFFKHNLRLNPNKTKFITFTQDKRTQPIISEIKIHKLCCIAKNKNDSCILIKKIDNIKYLGVVFDQYMKWDIQIKNLIIKMRKLNHFYINAKKVLDKSMLRMVYFAMTQSILQYGITAWGGLGIVAYNKLQTAQKSIIKIILNKPITYPSNELFKEMNVFNIKQLFYRNALYFTYKLNLINFKHTSHTTRRNNNKLIIPTLKTLKSSRYFAKVGLELLNNNIPSNILNCNSYTKYKHLIKIWLSNLQE
jgi:hypothetical protein